MRLITRISDLRRTIYGIVCGVLLPFIFTIPYVIYKNPNNYIAFIIYGVICYLTYFFFDKSKNGYYGKK